MARTSEISAPAAVATPMTGRVAVTLLVVCSFAVRVAASLPHSAPRLFPDEYLYTELARSLAAHGRPLIRGELASFPALLEPLLAAPFQAFFSPEHAYRLTQTENALFMSLAAIPAYLLARRLLLSEWYAVACAVIAVAIPDLVYAGYTIADPVAYPLVLGAVAAGVAAVDRPAPRSQVVFLLLTGLAIFARVQYVVLPAAFLAAAVLVDRRRVLRTQRLVLVLLAVPIAVAAAVGLSRVLGYYSNVTNLHVGTDVFRWVGIDLFLLTLVSGVVIVPGALVALARPHGRTETTFTAFTVVFIAGLVAEAAIYAANGSDRFQERYLFTALPLLPIAFGLYLKHRRPGRRAVAAVAVVIALVATRLPLSGYTPGNGKAASPFLFAVYDLEQQIGVANASLVVALLATGAAVGAVAVSRWGGGRAAIAATVAVAAIASFGAFDADRTIASLFRENVVASNACWVDAHGLHDVTLVQTQDSPPAPTAVQQLYWNRSITREALLGDAEPTDVYSAPRVRLARDGTLANVDGPLVFHHYGTTVHFANAQAVATSDPFTLYTFRGEPRLAVLAEGRYEDGWLNSGGRFTVWPSARQGTIRFALSLPPGANPVKLHLAGSRYRIRGGQTKQVRIPVASRAPWSAKFSSTGGSLRERRIVSVRSTLPTFAPARDEG